MFAVFVVDGKSKPLESTTLPFVTTLNVPDTLTTRVNVKRRVYRLYEKSRIKLTSGLVICLRLPLKKVVLGTTQMS